MTIESIRKITAQDMHDYIEKNCPQDKKWFMSVAFIDGKYNHLKAKREFIKRYAPELVKDKKPSASSIFSDWQNIK